jgi:hypothetical protein
MPIDQIWEASRIAHIAGQRLHEDRKTRLPLDNHVEDSLV